MRSPKVTCEPTGLLTVRLFGSCAAERDGAPLPRTRSRTEQWLLALLVLRHDQPLERSLVAGMLWPDRSESGALANLRRSLVDLRRVLGPDTRRLTAPSPRKLRLDLAGASVDVLEFDAAIARGDAASLEQAVALYRGVLLEGCMEEWVLAERTARELPYLSALETLAAYELGRGELSQAVSYLRRLVAADPLRESAHRGLMEALAQDGDPGAAVQTYRDLRLLLHREVHADPAPETMMLFERIRARRNAEGPHAEGTRHPRKAEREGIDALHPSSGALWPIHPSKGRLPYPASSLIGRERDVEEVRARLGCGRLVTLVGPGGVGKTRLAIQVAHEVTERYADGACFVDLAPLVDPALVPRAVALALGIREEPGRPLVGTLEASLREQSLLVVLDNCEHLIEACAQLVDALLQAAPRLRILATSREALRVPGEALWNVPSLPVPPPELAAAAAGQDGIAALLEYAGLRLFVERVGQAQPGFGLTPERAVAAAEICAHLDGIPLAIELAAARVPVLSVAEIAARLADRFGLLTGGSRLAPRRQQTLRGTLDWSYELLTGPEQAVLRRLSVFAGGFTLEAAEAMGVGLHLLSSLAAKSLVIVEAQEVAGEEDVRYRLLETVREYGHERLREAGEWEQFRERHGAYFLELLCRWQPELGKPGWFQRLEREYPNVRLALEWSLSNPAHAAPAVSAARSLQTFWLAQAYISEGRGWWARALTSPGWLPLTSRGWALCSAGELALRTWDHAEARSLLEEAAAVARRTGEAGLLAYALLSLGTIAVHEDDYQAAASLHQESLAQARQAGVPLCAGWALIGIARISSALGQPEQAGARAEESLALFRGIGDPQGIAAGLHMAGLVVLNHGGDLARARAMFEESLALSRASADYGSAAETLTRLGDLVRLEGDLALARAMFEESLALRRKIGDRMGVAGSLSELAFVALDEDRPAAARPLLEESLRLRREFADRLGVARMLLYLGHVARRERDLAGARRLYEESLALGKELAQTWVTASCLVGLGLVETAAGDEERARALMDEALSVCRQAGETHGMVQALRACGKIGAAAQPGPEGARRAAQLFGAAEALLEPAGQHDPTDFERLPPAVRASLGQQAFDEAWAAGRALTLEEAITLAGL